jgi:protease-4
MNNFLKYMFASTLGTILGFIFIFILSGIIMAGIIGSAMMFADRGKDDVEVKPNTVLTLDISDAIIERAAENPFAKFQFDGMDDGGKNELSSVLGAIENAKSDTNIKGIVIRGASFNGGLATLQNLRVELLDFRESGKWIIAYEEMYTQSAYYLASAADEVYMFKEGGLDFRGLRSEVAFFKGAMDKLGIEAIVIKGADNKYKSAVEPFYRENMSAENKVQMQRILDNIWTDWTSNLAESRGITPEVMNDLADNLKIDSPDAAVEFGFVDELVYYDQFEYKLKEKLGLEDDDDLETMSIGKYSNVKPEKKEDKNWELKDEIAVIYAVGGIGSGEGDEESIGSETLAKAIRDARKDEDVKAIVMRVNSPGGSALASEVIWRESVLAGEEKPFVVSFGDVAASGGYYISTHAARIFGQTNTITGSIGAFGIIPNMRGFFNDKMGITFDVVKTNQFADFGTLSRDFDEAEIAHVQNYLDQVYTEFVAKVADGRGMTYDQVDSLGRGRVWTGGDALEIGLIDEIGDLNDAIAYAAAEADLEDYDVIDLPKKVDTFERFMKDFKGETKALVADWVLGEEAVWLQKVEQVKEMDGVQVRLPFEMRVY